jgi:hypothetical protein
MTVVKAMVVATLTAMVVHAELVIYPNPTGLSNCTNLSQSTRFSVKVNGTSVFVYRSEARTAATPCSRK